MQIMFYLPFVQWCTGVALQHDLALILASGLQLLKSVAMSVWMCVYLRLLVHLALYRGRLSCLTCHDKSLYYSSQLLL